MADTAQPVSPEPQPPFALWAPWRMEYLRRLENKQVDCFFCRYRDLPDRDAENHVLWRGPRAFAMLNGFPYNGGHCLVAPYDHLGEMTDLPEETLAELMLHVRDLQRVIRQAMGPDGFNIGGNLGRCAGAGLPGHLHLHVVPRWSGDTNFMPVLGNVHVIPDFLSKMYAALREAADGLALPWQGLAEG